MKTLPMAVFAILFVVSMLSNNAVAADKKNERTEVFSVDLHCHSCVNKIEGNIAYEKGVKDMKVSLDKKEVTVTFRTDKTSTEMLIKAFNKLGYDAHVVGENPEGEKQEKVDQKTQKH